MDGVVPAELGIMWTPFTEKSSEGASAKGKFLRP
jgi:hypothetical protein